MGELPGGERVEPVREVAHHRKVAHLAVRGWSPELRCWTRRTVAYRVECSCGERGEWAGSVSAARAAGPACVVAPS